MGPIIKSVYPAGATHKSRGPNPCYYKNVVPGSYEYWGGECWITGRGRPLFELVELAKSVSSTDQAFKADAGKPRFDLLMDGLPNALLDVVKVLSWAVAEKKDATWAAGGGKGYKPHSWKEVPEAKRRYRAAMQRHENAIARGEVNDPESGLPHRAHIACNALFLQELDFIKE